MYCLRTNFCCWTRPSRILRYHVVQSGDDRAAIFVHKKPQEVLLASIDRLTLCSIARHCLIYWPQTPTRRIQVLNIFRGLRSRVVGTKTIQIIISIYGVRPGYFQSWTLRTSCLFLASPKLTLNPPPSIPKPPQPQTPQPRKPFSLPYPMRPVQN